MSEADRFAVTWKGTGQSARRKPDPSYPNGVHLDLTQKGQRGCTIALSYPAAEVGAWLIECRKCGLRAAVSAAGRRDDPRTVRVACKAAE